MATTIETLNQVNTGSFLTPEVWAKDILYANQPNFVFMQFSSKAYETDGNTIRWAVAGTMNPGGTLAQGTSLLAGTLTISQITTNPQEHGNLISWSRMTDLLSFTDMRTNPCYNVLKDDYTQYMDSLAYNVLKAGTWYSHGGTFGTAVPTNFAGTLGAGDYLINSGVISGAVARMKNRNVPTFDNGRYTMVLHVNQVERLYLDGTFREIQRYMTSEAPLINGVKANGWRCAYAGADIYENNRITTTSLTFGTSGTISAYQGVAFGKDAFGDGWSIPLEINYYDELTPGNAKRDKGIAWYALGCVKVLKPENVQVIRTTA